MRKILKRRPSAGVVIGVIALVAAFTGTAIAGNLIHFSSLAKDTKQKVLPYGASAQTTNCNPTGASFTTCASINLSVSKTFQRRAWVVADGTFTTDPTGSKGSCQLQVDGSPINTGLARLGAGPGSAGPPPNGVHDGDKGDGFGLNAITAPFTGTKAISLACNQATPNFKIQDISISAITLRG